MKGRILVAVSWAFAVAGLAYMFVDYRQAYDTVNVVATLFALAVFAQTLAGRVSRPPQHQPGPVRWLMALITGLVAAPVLFNAFYWSTVVINNMDSLGTGFIPWGFRFSWGAIPIGISIFFAIALRADMSAQAKDLAAN